MRKGQANDRPWVPSSNRNVRRASAIVSSVTTLLFTDRTYSITSSARPRIVSGKVRPSIFAVFMLMISSILVDICTARSARLLAVQDAGRVGAGEMVGIRVRSPIAHQSAGWRKVESPNGRYCIT